MLFLSRVSGTQLFRSNVSRREIVARPPMLRRVYSDPEPSFLRKTRVTRRSWYRITGINYWPIKNATNRGSWIWLLGAGSSVCVCDPALSTTDENGKASAHSKLAAGKRPTRPRYISLHPSFLFHDLPPILFPALANRSKNSRRRLAKRVAILTEFSDTKDVAVELQTFATFLRSRNIPTRRAA